ncbi:DUF4224 domain-containing protein [Massilia forsythiae]|uniref:DUF4224 domain-containing protein n=2 Tax=Massilia forsythiae TaxID=2728020 RepID=A0A7Z2W283_9BURK|nr:DUF4224 domain-containing protein [Massilia forsythiae]
MEMSSEALNADEVAELSGCSRKADQIEWLTQNGWLFIRNRAGAPVIGRLYARLKLAGINPAQLAAPEVSSWQPDFSKVR